MALYKVVVCVLLCLNLNTVSQAQMVRTFEEIIDENVTLTFEWNDFGYGLGDNITEAHYYFMLNREAWTNTTIDLRPGHSTVHHSCNRIRAVPSVLRNPSNINPRGISEFYQKYTEAYGIPVLGAPNIIDDYLRRACYTLRFMLADNGLVRNSFYRMSGRVVLISAHNGFTTTEIPELAWLGPSWNLRVRGLGATASAPVATAAEENLGCFYYGDRFSHEDILMHSLAHGILLLGARFAIPGWEDRLDMAYSDAQTVTGKWNNTYSMRSPYEYFAEGVQSYFGENGDSDQPSGIDGAINSKEQLQQYDPTLYELVHEVFPCENSYINRCISKGGYGYTVHREMEQRLTMDCD